MISLAMPWVLIALPLPVLVWWLIPPHRDRVPALRFPFFRRIADHAGVDPRPGAVVLSRGRVQMGAAVLCWVLTVLALAGPERVGQPVELTKTARDVVLAIDISGSMDARDFETPDGTRIGRLEAVRAVVQDFVAGRDGDRVALIAFGSRAYLQAPLTEDLRSISDLLDRTEVGMAGPHTAIGDAIGLAIRTFENSKVEDRLLILLSDGTDTASRMDPINAAEIAAHEGVEIYTIGVGDPNGQGEDKVDLQALEDIAARSGGAYFFAQDAGTLDAVYARIDQMAPRQTETLSYRPRWSLAHLPMAGALMIALLTVGWLHLGSSQRARP